MSQCQCQGLLWARAMHSGGTDGDSCLCVSACHQLMSLHDAGQPAVPFDRECMQQRTALLRQGRHDGLTIKRLSDTLLYCRHLATSLGAQGATAVVHYCSPVGVLYSSSLQLGPAYCCIGAALLPIMDHKRCLHSLVVAFHLSVHLISCEQLGASTQQPPHIHHVVACQCKHQPIATSASTAVSCP